MVTIKVISDRGVEDKKIPQCFADLQWVDYVEGICADKENEPVVGVLSALTGIRVEDFELMSIENQSFILNACSFFWDEAPEYIEVPESVKELSIAQGTWQQLIDCESEFKRVAVLDKPQIAAAQMIIKTYTKEFVQKSEMNRLNVIETFKASKERRLPELLNMQSKEIKSIDGVKMNCMKVPEALGYWSFFFCSSMSGTSDGKTCTTINQTTMRKPQGSPRFRRSDGSPRFMHLRKGTSLNTNRYWIKKPSTSILPYYLKRQNANIQKRCSITILKQINR